MTPPLRSLLRRLGPAALFIILIAGCRENPVATYEVAREQSPPAADPHAGMKMPMPSAGVRPPQPAPAARLEWTRPAGWTEKPASEMRLASYGFTAPDGTTADVSVFSFPDAAGGLLANINRWRGQVGLEPVAAPEQSATSATIAGQAAWLVDFVGTPTGAAPMMGSNPPPSGPTRIVGAIVPLGGQAWFFKMMGADATVLSQRDAFHEMIASIRAVTPSAAAAAEPAPDPHAGMNIPGLTGTATTPDPHAGIDMSAMAAGAVPAPGAPAGFAFEVPAGWQPQQGSSMRVASFLVPGRGVPAADVSVFALGGPAGGELANVNRWRAQLGLPAISAAELDRSAERVQAGGETFRVFEMESPGATIEGGHRARLLAAILPRSDRTWFVKMTGETTLVAAQRPTFLEFLRSFRFDANP